jgi:hypothetical protein
MGPPNFWRPCLEQTRVSQACLSDSQSKWKLFSKSNLAGWPGGRVTTDMPGMVNIRQDPFERTPSIQSESLNTSAGGYMNDFYGREFWRFVLVQQKVEELAKTAIEYPPMQDPASFNLEAVSQNRRSNQEQAWAVIEPGGADKGCSLPLVVRWPGHITPGTIKNQMFAALDWRTH